MIAAPSRLDARDLLAEAEGHVLAAQDVLQRLADLAVEERQHPRARSTTVTFVPSGRTSTRTPRRSRRRRRRSSCAAPLVEVQEAVGVDDRRVVEGDVGRPRRWVPTAITMLSAVNSLLVVLVARSATVCSSTNEPSPNSRPTPLRRNCSRTTAVSAPTTRAVRSIRYSTPPLAALGVQRVGHVERPPGELVEHRLAQRLGRDRAGVDRDAAEPLPALDDRHALAELGGLDGRPLAAGPRADDEEIQVHGASLTPRSPLPAMRRGQRHPRGGREPGAAPHARAPGRRRAARFSCARPSPTGASRAQPLATSGGRTDRCRHPARASRWAIRTPARRPRPRSRSRARRRRRPRSPRARARRRAAQPWPAASRPAAAARASGSSAAIAAATTGGGGAVEPERCGARHQVAGGRAVAAT